MPARSEWKGYLEVNQLRVPVKAFSAVQSTPEITLNQLHRGCGERIRQQKQCPIHGPVEPSDIIPGYRVAEDCCLPLDPEEIEALKPDADKSIAVECFVDQHTIDPMFHSGRTLYLVPDGPPGQRPFGVLREGMKAAGRYAFSRIVLSRIEVLVLLRPMGRLLAMTVLEYPQRVRSTADYESEVAAAALTEYEKELAGQLIDTMTDHQFDLSRYRNRYMDRLSALIEQKVAESDLTRERPFAPADDPEPASDESLIAVLKASLETAGVGDLSPPSLRDRYRLPVGEPQAEQKPA